MNKPHLLIRFTLLIALAAGCSPVPVATPPPTQPAPTATPARLAALHFELDQDPNVTEMPYLLAIEALRKQGYDVTTTPFDDLALAVAAMSKGDIDMTTAGFQIAWSAVAQGAPIVTVLDRNSNTFLIVTRQDLTQCADLDGKKVAINNINSVLTAMFAVYIKTACPEATPETLVVSGASNRRAALAAGEVDAAMLQIDDLDRMETESPGTYHALLVYADQFPNIQTSGFTIRRSLAEQYPETVKDIIRAIMLSRRSLQDPKVLADEIHTRFDLEPAEAEHVANLYLQNKVWAVNARFNLQTVKASLEFLQTNAGMAPELKPEDVADWSYSDAVMDEIGRQ